MFSSVILLPLLYGFGVKSSPTKRANDPTYFFAFGDSYTTDFFNITGTQPSATNPIGNPLFDSATISGGENWVKFLTATYNASLVLTYDLGVAGATIDQNLVRGASVDLLAQTKTFEEHFTTDPPWTSKNSVFGFWFGINDVNNGYTESNISAIHKAEITEYFSQAHALYQSGARNFFFLEAPPLERFPVVLDLTAAQRNLEVSVKNDFNAVLRRQHDAFKSSHQDAESVLVNVDSAFDVVLDNPQKYGAPNATCTNTDGESCLWYNGLHAGIQIHKQVALKVAGKVGLPFF